MTDERSGRPIPISVPLVLCCYRVVPTVGGINHPCRTMLTNDSSLTARFIGRGLAIVPIGACSVLIGALRLSVPFNADGTFADNSSSVPEVRAPLRAV